MNITEKELKSELLRAFIHGKNDMPEGMFKLIKDGVALRYSKRKQRRLKNDGTRS